MMSSQVAPQQQQQLEVMQDILAALEDYESLADVSLVGHDGLEVPACRFVLAARSIVLKRMLYGNFREARESRLPSSPTASSSSKTKTSQHPKIELLGYSNQVLTMVVNYCTKGQFLSQQQSSISSSCTANEEFVRHIVQVAKAADYLEISGLVRKAESLVKKLVAKHPLLACPVFDEADEGSVLFTCAKRMIQCRPYAALASSSTDAGSASDCCEGGGIECLQSDRVVVIMKDTEMEAGELFLFNMLKRWVDHVPEAYHEEALNVARECGNYFRLHYIEPEELLSTVQKSELFAPNLIVEAIMRQALKASQSRVWTINCRGKDTNVDRVLVEGCGHNEVNGVYYRIRGLHKGDVYSKREVSCGQLYVYTLSCSQKEDTIESRIFGSKVMTHRGIPSIVQQQQTEEETPAPVIVFQPLLQVISLEDPRKQQCSTGSSPLAKLCKIELSDGDQFITGTLAPILMGMVEDEQLVENSLVKVLAYDLYNYEGKNRIHILDLNCKAHPGHRLGKPVEMLTPASVDRSSDMPLSGRQYSSYSDDNDGLQKMYSCYYHMDKQAKDSKIPRTGWKVEENGMTPAPRCTWIPATVRRFGDISRCNSQEEEDNTGKQVNI